jgi:predicted anti-sigma-YlaC factor YlaD
MRTHPSDEQLVLYCTGDLQTPGVAAVEGHLAECSTCRDVVADTRAVLSTVSSPTIPERGDRYTEQLWAAIAPRLDRGRRLPARQSPGWLAWALGAAAMLAVAFGAYHMGRRARKPLRRIGCCSPALPSIWTALPWC